MRGQCCTCFLIATVRAQRYGDATLNASTAAAAPLLALDTSALAQERSYPKIPDTREELELNEKADSGALLLKVYDRACEKLPEEFVN